MICHLFNLELANKFGAFYSTIDSHRSNKESYQYKSYQRITETGRSEHCPSLFILRRGFIAVRTCSSRRGSGIAVSRQPLSTGLNTKLDSRAAR